MNPEQDTGLQSLEPDEAFHEYMLSLYQKQGRAKRGEARDAYHVQAKLPGDLYAQFFQWLKDNHFSKSRGVQYAIHKLVSEQ